MNSSRLEVQAARRRRDLGLMQISGLRKSRFTFESQHPNVNIFERQMRRGSGARCDAGAPPPPHPPPESDERKGTRKVDIRLPGKGNSHGARPVNQMMSMIKWIRTSRLPTKNSLSLGLMQISGLLKLRRTFKINTEKSLTSKVTARGIRRSLDGVQPHGGLQTSCAKST